jgi:hypothetical protein
MKQVPTITNYLSAGGFFNPEQMQHERVSELLAEIRERLILARTTAGKGTMNGEPTWHLTAEATKALEALI